MHKRKRATIEIAAPIDGAEDSNKRTCIGSISASEIANGHTFAATEDAAQAESGKYFLIPLQLPLPPSMAT